MEMGGWIPKLTLGAKGVSHRKEVEEVTEPKTEGRNELVENMPGMGPT